MPDDQFRKWLQQLPVEFISYLYDTWQLNEQFSARVKKLEPITRTEVAVFKAMLEIEQASFWEWVKQK